MIRVLIADDHPVVRAGYQRLLEQAGDIRVVADANDGQEAYAAWVAHRPDVLVTDLSMPAGGLELIRRVLQRNAEARVLVFSMHDSALLVRRALEAGARGYIPKSSPPECLVDGVRALHAGRRYLAPELPADLLQRDPQDETERLADAERARVRGVPPPRAGRVGGAVRAGAQPQRQDGRRTTRPPSRRSSAWPPRRRWCTWRSGTA